MMDANGEWWSALLPFLSGPADERAARCLLERVREMSGAAHLHLRLTGADLPDWSWSGGGIACYRAPRPAPSMPAGLRATALPLCAGEEALGELRFYGRSEAAPRLAQLLSAFLRAARAELLRERGHQQQAHQQLLVHDLRSPLATLRAYLDLLAAELTAESETGCDAAPGVVAESLAAMRRAADQQEQLLGQLLSLYEAQQRPWQPRSLRILPLLEAALAEQADALALAGVHLQRLLDIPPTLRLSAEGNPPAARAGQPAQQRDPS